MAPPVPVMLPYYRDPTELPGPLPTSEEKRNAPKSELSPRRYDPSTPSIRYVPQPTLWASSPSYGIHSGVDLESLWSSLSVDAKSSIATQLQPLFTQIRSLVPPQEFIGGVCGGKIPDPLFNTFSPDAKINGPFRAEEDVGLALARASRGVSEQNGAGGWMADFFGRHLPVSLKGYGTRFTHGDLDMRNILVVKVPKEATSNSTGTEAEDTTDTQRWDYHISGIVDWELAGGYPAYWEYVAAFVRFQWDSD